MNGENLPPTGGQVLRLLFGGRRNKPVLLPVPYAGLPGKKYGPVFPDNYLKPEAAGYKPGIADVKAGAKTGKITGTRHSLQKEKFHAYI
jgi:hypothetical protein